MSRNRIPINALAIVVTLVVYLFAIAAPAAPKPAPAVVPADHSPDVTELPAYDKYIVIPLIHILSADDLPDVDCKLKDADIDRILGKANGIWHKAGVHFGLESIIHEPAVKRSTFAAAKEKGQAVPLPVYRLLRPEGSKAFEGLHVYYVHEMAVNGVFMGEDFAFVKETASLKKVENGIDEPIPRVTSHELGHALGLEHRQDRTNLMASGTTGTLLNQAEVTKAREKAGKVKGALTIDQAWQAAEEAANKKETARAKMLFTWIAGIPGERSAAAKRKLVALGPTTRP